MPTCICRITCETFDVKSLLSFSLALEEILSDTERNWGQLPCCILTYMSTLFSFVYTIFMAVTQFASLLHTMFILHTDTRTYIYTWLWIWNLIVLSTDYKKQISWLNHVIITRMSWRNVSSVRLVISSAGTNLQQHCSVLPADNV